jgi:hypothetical protein
MRLATRWPTSCAVYVIEAVGPSTVTNRPLICILATRVKPGSPLQRMRRVSVDVLPFLAREKCRPRPPRGQAPFSCVETRRLHDHAIVYAGKLGLEGIVSKRGGQVATSSNPARYRYYGTDCVQPRSVRCHFERRC